MIAGLTVPVVIVGAGPTGAAAAIELGRRGIECLVLDRWEDVYPQPRAVHLDDEVHRILDRLGVGSQFASISRPSVGLRLVDRQMRVLGEVMREGLSPANGRPRANMFDQPELEALLRARVDAHETVTLRGNAVVTGVEQVSADRVTVRFRDAGTGNELSVDAEFVLGCDGANSVVRGSINASLQALGFEQRWLVVDLDTKIDLKQWEGVHQVCDSTRAATYLRIGPTRYRWEFQLLPHESSTDFATIAQLRPLLRPWTSDIDPIELRVLRVAEYTFKAAIADQWRSERIFLLGDAAHLTPPFIGQGMGAGIRDATNLGWKVAGFLDGRLSADVLDSFEPERTAHARSLIQLARRMGVLMTRGGRAGDKVRRVVVPAVTRVPGLHRQVRDSATPPLGGSDWIAARRADRLAGHLCPNARLDEVSFDELQDRSWALVTNQSPSPSDTAALRARNCIIVETRDGDHLASWLRGGGATAALVRPDCTVMASGADVPSLCALVTRLIAPAPVTAA